MPVTLESIKPFEKKTLQMTVDIQTAEGIVKTDDKFTITGVMPQGVVLFRKKHGPSIVQLDDIYSFDAPEAEAPKIKVKTLKAVDESSVTQHALDRHGATVEWASQVAVADQLAWHVSVHETNNLGHKHAAPVDETGPLEDAAAEESSE